jgi:hypothetical protein
VWLAQELRHAYNIKSFSVDKRKKVETTCHFLSQAFS